jgi:micrococcal nuclease
MMTMIEKIVMLHHHQTVRLFFFVSLLLLCLAGCGRVNVEADNRYGFTRGAAVVTVPLPEGGKSGSVKAGEVPVWSVDDGSTLTVLRRGAKERVRLIGIDAPGLDQAPWGEQSRDALKKLVEGKSVRLAMDARKHDQDSVLLAYVYEKDVLVNLEMVRQGQAMISSVPPNAAHLAEFQQAQAEAQKARRGIWDRDKPFIPPSSL